MKKIDNKILIFFFYNFFIFKKIHFPYRIYLSFYNYFTNIF